MRAVVVASLAVVTLVASSACESCSCSPIYGNFAAILLTEKDTSQTVPLGMYQTVGVLLQGAGRTINVSDPELLVPYAVQEQPAGMTFERFVPDSPNGAGRPYVFGGTVTVSAPATAGQPAWQATVIMGTDPRGQVSGLNGVGAGAFVGGGTTVMTVGQSFVVSWAAGRPAPASSNPPVLRPTGDPVTVHNGYQQAGQTTMTSGPDYEQQLFVAVGVGIATLSAAGDAIRTVDPNAAAFGGSQTFVVRLVPGFTCSPTAGCVQTTPVGSQGFDRPDRYYPAGVTPSP